MVWIIVAMTGILWSICWMYIVYDTPEKHPRISAAEKHYIQKSLSGHTHTIVNAVSLIQFDLFEHKSDLLYCPNDIHIKS